MFRLLAAACLLTDAQMPSCCVPCGLLASFATCLLPAVEKAVRTMFSYLERSRTMLGSGENGNPDSSVAAAEAAAAAAAGDPAVATADPYQQQQAAAPPLVRPRSPKLLLSVGVSQVSLLWLVSRAGTAGWQGQAALCCLQPVFTAYNHRLA